MAKKKTSRAKSATSKNADNRTEEGLDAALANLSFEEALEQLQEVVSTLEHGQLTLSQSLQAYEKGVGLLKVCHGGLEHAEQRIRILTGISQDGRVQLEDFDQASTAETLQPGMGTRRTATSESGDKKSGGSATSASLASQSDNWDPIDDEIDDEDFDDEVPDSDDDSDQWEAGRLF